MADEQDYMLTTVDNPYNPFTQWEMWLAFDTQMGYDSCQYLDRVSTTSDGFTEAETDRELNRAINWIVNNDPFNRYRKVTKDSFDQIMAETLKNVEEFGNDSTDSN